MKLLKDRVVVVTGAGNGVGRAEAVLFAELGARVLVSDVGSDVAGTGADPAVAAAVVDHIRRAGGTALADTGDVREPGAVERLIERAATELGGFDAFVHAAGIAREATILKSATDDFTDALDLHVRVAFEAVRGSAQRFLDEKKTGAIVLHTSPSAFFGVARQAAQGAAAAGVVALVRSAAVELRRHAIRVNAIAPTARTRLTEDTPLFKGIRGDSMTPEHVAPVAAFLVSDLAAEIHGEVVGVAGQRLYGLLARETTGTFLEGRVPTPEQVAAAWSEVTRGA